jgi:hypothetical protein
MQKKQLFVMKLLLTALTVILLAFAASAKDSTVSPEASTGVV